MLNKTINWQLIEDELDEYVWDKATAQFWLDTRVPVSNDLLDWRKLSDMEKEVVKKAVGGLTIRRGLICIKEKCKNLKREGCVERLHLYGIHPCQNIWNYFNFT